MKKQTKWPKWLKVYDSGFRGKCPLEAAEQATFFNRIRREYPDTYGKIATHIKNEGRRTPQQIQKDRAQGLTKGASDIIIPCSPAFVCELKRKDRTKSTVYDEQIEYLKAAHDLGGFSCLAFGVDEAWEAFKSTVYSQRYLCR
jgi:hypothetical protein